MKQVEDWQEQLWRDWDRREARINHGPVVVALLIAMALLMLRRG